MWSFSQQSYTYFLLRKKKQISRLVQQNQVLRLIKFFSGGNTIYCLFPVAWEQLGGKSVRSSVNAAIVTISERPAKFVNSTEWNTQMVGQAYECKHIFNVMLTLLGEDMIAFKWYQYCFCTLNMKQLDYIT